MSGLHGASDAPGRDAALGALQSRRLLRLQRPCTAWRQPTWWTPPPRLPRTSSGQCTSCASSWTSQSYRQTNMTAQQRREWPTPPRSRATSESGCCPILLASSPQQSALSPQQQAAHQVHFMTDQAELPRQQPAAWTAPVLPGDPTPARWWRLSAWTTGCGQRVCGRPLWVRSTRAAWA